MTGDENVGACLAPGGDAYYVWITRDDVRLVDRSNPFLGSFRFSSLNRSINLETVSEKRKEWPKVGLVLLDTLGVGVACGGTIGSALTGGGIPVSVILGGGCVYMAYRFSVDSVGISHYAETGVNAFIAFRQHELDATYEFCRMEGRSDADCK